MKFEKFTCWEPSEFKKVVYTEAETIPDDIFLAVHTDNKINLSIYGNKQKEVTYNKFLSEFLEGDYGNNVQTVIEGESGSGKSHLVQWIRQHIPKTDKRYVLNIPKTETNLHSVLKKLIELLPNEKRIEYSTKLQKKDVGLNNDLERKHIFLSSLANSILMDTPSTTNYEEEEFLIQQIPNLFNDPYVRDNHFNKHPIIDSIISLIFENSAVNRNNDKRQEFQFEHLLLNATELEFAAVPTREIIEIMNDEEDDLRNIALGIINRNLDKAISRTLNFTPDDLIELMSEIRSYLYKNDEELILLIEDFAQLQGVDTALLQVLTVDGAGELCKIKWAMAVTTGYFEKLEDTVRTRMTFKINMDSLWDKNDKGKQNKYILNLASKYLNAIRLGSSNIDDWYKNYNNSEELIPNKCDNCQHQSICIESFDEVNGVSLYPFNKIALLSMARTADKEKTDIFRPREFLNKVLYRNLNQNSKELIESGLYPDSSLLDDFSIHRLNTEELHVLEQKDSINYERRRTLIELWSNSQKVVNINENIHNAFSLPLLIDVKVIEKSIPKQEIEPLVVVSKDEKTNPLLDAIEDWGKGSELRDNEKNQLTKIIYNAIEANINWDMLPISKSLATTLMSPRHIYFENQQTNKQRTGIVLEIKCTSENAIVIKNLYKINNTKSLPNDINSFAMIQNKIDIWSNYFINELYEYFEEKDNWNPVNASIELLLINTVIGENKLDIAGLFSEYNEVPMASTEFNLLLRNTFSNDAINVVLLEVLQKTYTGRKGGDKTKSFIDAKKVLGVISTFKKNKYRLIQDPSKEDRKEFKEVVSLYKRWQDEFNNALESELEERFQWLDKLTNRVEISDISSDFKKSINKLKKKLLDNGIVSNSTRLDNLINCDFQQVKSAFDNSLKLKNIDIKDIFIELFPSRKADAIKFIQLIDVYEEYLVNAQSRIQSRANEFNRQSNTEDVVNSIDTYIIQIDDKLQKIQGDNNDS
ncbi:MAG: hypothetical protein CL624_04485 [Arcobacter sp.]|nr:hypothetical protein [Arcobacter sp.]|tara:strand:- start:1453 stop:4404 length:2952 start_codon:yes stop_codon:yes gene_type:complete